ncbi:MAG: M6 family metalloprotease domain-containing protein [Euryarchaeota archaeon]|nr:M6 family metalloprotease domain-containing protein [Euryarchaeota archaeon]
MRNVAVLLACLLMLTGGMAALAGVSPSPARAVSIPPAPNPAPAREVAGSDGPRDLVPPAPWNTQADPGPFSALDRSRHPDRSPLTVTGEAKVLAILVSFSDKSNSSAHTPKFFEDLLYNASASSMNKFFRDNSYNLFNVTGNVTTKFYAMSNTLAYYGTYETSSPPPGGYGNSQNLTYDAVMAADSDINYSDYDQDKDGYLDHLVIIHAGGDQASTGVSTDIWSHAWGLNALAVKLDGVWINAYTMLSEDDPVGVFVHEFGHDLGLPDLYDTDYSSDGGCGRWEVMASGSWNNAGKSPSMLSAWCRQELGWLKPEVVNADTAGLAAKRVFDNQTAFKIWANNSNNEYFLVENRQQTGWDSYLPGSGLLIWHINESAPGNKRDSFRLVDLEEWDNNNNAANANDAWRSNSTGFTPTSAPNSNDYSGKRTDIRIFNISGSGATMYFDVDLGNTAPHAPSPTAPGDGAWLGVSSPTLNWSYSDPDTGDTQAAYRVQVDGDGAFGSVDWDSGDVASSNPYCTVGAGLSEGKWYWRVRTRDGGGLWGSYNAGRSFNIDLTAPAAPTALSATPSGWTAENSFSIDWTAPSETGTSGIANGAYYKLDTAPTGATDGTWVASKPMTGITVGSAGNHTIYVWLKDGVGNVNHTNRRAAYLYFDNVAPANPGSLTSPTHTVDSWSNISVVQVQWSGASDADSGLDGYSYVWDQAANTLPDATRDCAPDISSATSASFPDGSYYFHIRSVDKVGNWAPAAVHLGPFKIDLSPPGGVQGASSSSHTVGRWSPQNTISVQWWGAADGGSGVGAFAYAWDLQPDTVPDGTATVGSGVSTLTSAPRGDSAGWYFHVRVRDSVGNWNLTAFHLGPFDIDTTPPSNPDSFSVLSRQVVGTWSAERLVRVSWSGQNDALSGVAGFSFSWDGDPAGTTDLTADVLGAGYDESNQEGVRYLHIRAVDVAGNWAGGVYTVGPFMIDLSAPSAPDAVAARALTNERSVRWTWDPADDVGSGVAYYIVWIVTDPARPEEGVRDTTFSTSYAHTKALDGWTYHLQVRAVDAVGNAGQFGELSGGVLVDLSPPRDLRLVIDSGAALTGQRTVRLALWARDAVSGVSEMRLAQDGGEWSDWEPFAESRELRLTGADGTRTVRFQARDLAGNGAAPAGGSIVLDTAGPDIVSFGRPGGSAFTADRRLTLEVVASDALSRVVQARLGGDGEVWGQWQPYGSLLDYELPGTDGLKEVHVQTRDEAGNIGPAARLELRLDTTPPGKPVVSSSTHPGTDTWYNLAEAEFVWQAPPDESGIAGYAWIVTPERDDEPGYSVQLSGRSLRLPVPGEGRWFFMVRAIDGAGNCGLPMEYSFRVDLEGPKPPRTDLPLDNWDFAPSDQVALSWSGAADALSGVKGYLVQVDDDADYSSLEWEGVVDQTGHVLPPLPEGSYHWRVKARDGAGNWGDHGTGSSFNIRTPVTPIPPGHKEPFLSLSNPLFLLTLVVLLAAVGGGIAAAARGRKKEPPAGNRPDQPVRWE